MLPAKAALDSEYVSCFLNWIDVLIVILNLLCNLLYLSVCFVRQRLSM